MKTMITTIAMLCGLAAILCDSNLSEDTSILRKNGMEVTWAFKNGRVQFEMKAPTTG